MQLPPELQKGYIIFNTASNTTQDINTCLCLTLVELPFNIQLNYGYMKKVISSSCTLASLKFPEDEAFEVIFHLNLEIKKKILGMKASVSCRYEQVVTSSYSTSLTILSRRIPFP